MKSRYESLDTSNPYGGISTAFENLTVNTQAAEFAQQQAEQGRADILSNLAASAGGGGIAALAQSLANQQTQAAQAASVSIGQQERQNQLMALEGRKIEGQGKAMSQQMEMEKTGNLLSMAAARKQAADQARSQALQTAIGGTISAGQTLAMGAGGGN